MKFGDVDIQPLELDRWRFFGGAAGINTTKITSFDLFALAELAIVQGRKLAEAEAAEAVARKGD